MIKKLNGTRSMEEVIIGSNEKDTLNVKGLPTYEEDGFCIKKSTVIDECR